MNHLTISLLKIPKPAVFQQKIQFDFKYGAGCSKINSAEGIKLPEVNTRGLSTCAWGGFQNVFTFSRIDSQQIHTFGFEERIIAAKEKNLNDFIFDSLSYFSLLFSIFGTLFFASQLQKGKSQRSIAELVGSIGRGLKVEFFLSFYFWFILHLCLKPLSLFCRKAG